jgi:hypothetical protein
MKVDRNGLGAKNEWNFLDGGGEDSVGVKGHKVLAQPDQEQEPLVFGCQDPLSFEREAELLAEPLQLSVAIGQANSNNVLELATGL